MRSLPRFLAAAMFLCSGIVVADAPPPTGAGRRDVPATTPPATPPTPTEPAAPAAPTPPAGGAAKVERFPKLSARIETSRGDIAVDLAPNAIPRLTAHFVNLVERGYYDDFGFHSVVEDVQLHTGDPTGSGDGTCGYELPPQFHRTLLYDDAGVLGFWMPRGHRVSSQLFITLAPNGRKYNLSQPGIGRIVDGLDVAKSITSRDRIIAITVEGDSTLLRSDFADELATWNAILDDPTRAGRALRPAPAPPSKTDEAPEEKSEENADPKSSTPAAGA